MFSHYGLIAGFASRRGSRDPDGIAAETMTIAWRRLDVIDPNHCRPWLLATARNLLMAEYRSTNSDPVDPASLEQTGSPVNDFPVDSLDPAIDRVLTALDPIDREALLLVAWDELSPKEAAESLGIRPATFRVRLHRARNKFTALLEPAPGRITENIKVSEENQ